MTDITMGPKTRIRVIKRALEILAGFTANLHKKLITGEIKMSSQLQIQSRKNAQEEGRLRRRLAELEAEIARLERPEDDTSDEDPVAALLMKAVLAGMPNLTSAEAIDDLPQGKNAILISRTDDDCLELVAAIADGRDMDQFAAELSALMFGISLDIPHGPNKGNAIFMTGFSKTPDDLPEHHRARAFQIFIAQGE